MRPKVKVVPSILDCDFAHLEREIRAVESAGIGRVHLDVMDGRFVPNITFGPMLVETVCRITEMRLDVHLMTAEPERLADGFIEAGAACVSFHVEATPHSHRLLGHIREAGRRCGIALNPATGLSAVEHLMDQTDLILIMTVNPGFGGQKFIEGMLEKIRRARAMIAESGREIDLAVDGGVNGETLSRVIEAGANYLIMGYHVFRHPGGPGAGARAALAEVEAVLAGSR
jgi:ribulose-phosphate 3-epimerase